MNLAWSVALAVLGIVGIWLAGSRRWEGWALGVVSSGGGATTGRG